MWRRGMAKRVGSRAAQEARRGRDRRARSAGGGRRRTRKRAATPSPLLVASPPRASSRLTHPTTQPHPHVCIPKRRYPLAHPHTPSSRTSTVGSVTTPTTLLELPPHTRAAAPPSRPAAPCLPRAALPCIHRRFVDRYASAAVVVAGRFAASARARSLSSCRDPHRRSSARAEQAQGDK